MLKKHGEQGNTYPPYKALDDSALKDGEKAILYYIAGYIVKCLARDNCEDCNELFTLGKVPLKITFENSSELSDDPDDPSLVAKEEFTKEVSRGGLRKHSDCMYISCVHASSLNRYIFKNEDTFTHGIHLSTVS